MVLMAAGPRMITKMHGKKNNIMGSVSFGGRLAAFFSASSNFFCRASWETTRSAEADNKIFHIFNS